MADIAGLAASAAGGGLFGIVGTALGRVAGFFEQRQKLAHEKARWEHEVQLIELQQTAAKAETEAEIALADLEGSWKGLDASMQAEASIRASFKWVDAVRGVTRPTLTLLLWLIAAGIWLGAGAGEREAITETATFAATAATLWWFGDRGPSRNSSAP